MAGILSGGSGGVLSQREPQSLLGRLGIDVASPDNQVALAFLNNVISTPSASPFQGVAEAAQNAQAMNQRKVQLAQIVKNQQQEDEQSAQLKKMLAGDPMALQFLNAGQPDEALRIYENNKGLNTKPGDPFTLGEGQIRYDANGNIIAQGPGKADAGEKPPVGYNWTTDPATGQRTLSFIPGGPADPGTPGKTTEATRRNQQLASVIIPEAESLLGDGTPQKPGTFDSLADLGNNARAATGGLGLIVGQGPSADFQQAQNSLKTIIASYLYSVSGATANPGEVENQAAILTPRPGEDPKSVAAKRERVRQMVEAVRNAAEGGNTSVPAFGGGNDPLGIR